MALIDRVKERTGSDLSDTELAAMIASIAAEMDLRFGPVGPVETVLGDPTDPDSRQRRTLRLTRPIDSGEDITIVEVDPANSGAAASEIELATGDYAILHGGRTLQRLTGGPNGRGYWAPLVRVSYTPVGALAEQAARDEAAIKLIQLDLSWRGGLKSERAGDYQITLSDNQAAEREKIFEGLATARGAGSMVLA